MDNQSHFQKFVELITGWIQLYRSVSVAGLPATTLINAARSACERASKPDDVLFIDIRLLDPAAAETSDPTFLLRALVLELHRHVSRKVPLTLESLKEKNEFFATVSETPASDLLLLIEDFTRQLQKPRRKIVLVFDDVDKTPLNLTLLSGARDILWKLNVVFLLTTNVTQYNAILDSAMEPFFKRMMLRGLAEADLMELLNKRFALMSNKRVSDVIDPHLVANIQKLSHGNPRLALMMCEQGLRRASSRNAQKITTSDISSYFIDRLEPGPYRELLEIMLNRPEGLSVKELYKLLGKRGITVSRSPVSQLLGELIRLGFVYMEKSRRQHKYATVISPKVLSK